MLKRDIIDTTRGFFRVNGKALSETNMISFYEYLKAGFQNECMILDKHVDNLATLQQIADVMLSHQSTKDYIADREKPLLRLFSRKDLSLFLPKQNMHWNADLVIVAITNCLHHLICLISLIFSMSFQVSKILRLKHNGRHRYIFFDESNNFVIF